MRLCGSRDDNTYRRARSRQARAASGAAPSPAPRRHCRAGPLRPQAASARRRPPCSLTEFAARALAAAPAFLLGLGLDAFAGSMIHFPSGMRHRRARPGRAGPPSSNSESPWTAFAKMTHEGSAGSRRRPERASGGEPNRPTPADSSSCPAARGEPTRRIRSSPPVTQPPPPPANSLTKGRSGRNRHRRRNRLRAPGPTRPGLGQ